MTRSHRWSLERRIWGGAVAAVALGAALYLWLAYRVLQAGGFTVTSVRASCAEAATGRASAMFRVSENVEIERTFLPISATCRWSGGTSAELVAVSWLSSVCLVLVIVGLAVLLWLRLARNGFSERGRRQLPAP